MSASNTRVGARIFVPLGRQGQAQDMVPARVVGPSQIAFQNGRAVEVAKVVMFKTTLQGDQILQERLHNLYFTFDRTERIEELDGTAEAPLSAIDLMKRAAAQLVTWLASREQAVDADALDEAIS